MNKDQQNLINCLQTLGCNEEETLVFLKIFSSPGLKASQIAERSGIKRVKVYDIIQSLADKNLILELSNTKVKTYITHDLNHLELILKEKINEFQKTKTNFTQSIPKLKDSIKALSSTTEVKYYQKADVPRILDQIIKNHSFKAIFNPILAFEKNKKVMQNYLASLEKTTHKVQEIISCDQKDVQQMFLRVKNPNFQAKILDSDINFDTDMILYDNQVFFGSYNSQRAIVISDPEIYNSLLQLHKKLWRDL